MVSVRIKIINKESLPSGSNRVPFSIKLRKTESLRTNAPFPSVSASAVRGATDLFAILVIGLVREKLREGEETKGDVLEIEHKGRIVV